MPSRARQLPLQGRPRDIHFQKVEAPDAPDVEFLSLDQDRF